MNSAALRRPRMAILEFQEPVKEASPHEITKAISLEREIKLGHAFRRSALYVAPASPIKQSAGRPPAAGQEGNGLIVTTSCISNQLSSPAGSESLIYLVGQTLLSVRYDIATAQADRQEYLSY